MNGELIAALVFVLTVGIFALIKRKQFATEGAFPFVYMAMYRTKLGLKLMDWLAEKYPRFWKWFGFFGIVLGFAGMALVTALLVYNGVQLIYALLTSPIQAQVLAKGVSLVLPFNVKGVFYVPFSFWLISLLIIVTMHELLHGVIARAHNMKIKSSGFAFLSVFIPLIPAAFVEPDKDEEEKRTTKERLSVLAAGSAINIIFALFVMLVLVPIISPAFAAVSDNNGVVVTELFSDKYIPNPSKEAGLKVGDRIVNIADNTTGKVTGHPVDTVEDLADILLRKQPGDKITAFMICEDGCIDGAVYYTRDITLGTNPGHDNENFFNPLGGKDSYMGISIQQSSGIREDIIQKYGTFFPRLIVWLFKLFYWMYLLAMGIGLINLAPIGPFDGGQMFHLAMKSFFRPSIAKFMWVGMSLLLIGTILLGVIVGFML